MSDWFTLRHACRLAAASALATHAALAAVPALAQGPSPAPIFDISRHLSNTARIGEHVLFDDPRNQFDMAHDAAAGTMLREEGIDPLVVQTVAFTGGGGGGGAGTAPAGETGRRATECGGLDACDDRHLHVSDILACFAFIGLLSLREGRFDITLGRPRWFSH